MSVCAVIYSVRGAVFFMATLFSVTVGELMPLIAVGIFHVVATKKGRELLPPFWALSLFFVADAYKSLGCLGK